MTSFSCPSLLMFSAPYATSSPSRTTFRRFLSSTSTDFCFSAHFSEIYFSSEVSLLHLLMLFASETFSSDCIRFPSFSSSPSISFACKIILFHYIKGTEGFFSSSTSSNVSFSEPFPRVTVSFEFSLLHSLV